jgi:CheY-like chemotaxis protein
MRTTILVVDDDDDLRATIADLLQEAGYEVDEAPNGVAALERIQARMPALILLDVRMPVMNGREFVRVFRERHDTRASVVVCTAAADAHPPRSSSRPAAGLPSPSSRRTSSRCFADSSARAPAGTEMWPRRSG